MMTQDDKDPKNKEQEEIKPVQPEPEIKEGLTQEDIPDSTNESTGIPGTGQRQDTN
jgi:hypothetical protein